jgi:uncharacterized protein YozE (UPF0346 family)
MKPLQKCHFSASSIKNAIFRHLLCLLPLFGHAQNVAEKEQIRNDSILAQFQENDDLKILSLLPSVGYDALNNSLTVGFNISQFSNYLQTKRRNKIELAKLENQLNEASKLKIERNFERLEKYLADFQDFTINLSSLTILEQLFEISQGKYNSGEITTEQYLKEKLTFSNQFFGFLRQASRLEIEAGNIDVIFNQNTFLVEINKIKKILLEKAQKTAILNQ